MAVLFVSTRINKNKNKTVYIKSETLKQEKMPVNILLPDGYHKDKSGGYPVIYLLHGNRRFAAELSKLKIDYEYREVPVPTTSLTGKPMSITPSATS
ncbi:MAG: esterase family protein [bacterium]|nr:esterase family protein [bacterium]